MLPLLRLNIYFSVQLIIFPSTFNDLHFFDLKEDSRSMPFRLFELTTEHIALLLTVVTDWIPDRSHAVRVVSSPLTLIYEAITLHYPTLTPSLPIPSPAFIYRTSPCLNKNSKSMREFRPAC